MAELLTVIFWLAVASAVLWLGQKLFKPPNTNQPRQPTQSELDHFDRMSEVKKKEREIAARRAKLEQKKGARQARDIDDLFRGDLKPPDDNDPYR